MRTKRKQKRKAKSDRAVPSGPPDPFSALNPEIVRYEEWRADMCPCCLERVESDDESEIRWARFAQDWERELDLQRDIRWNHLIPSHGFYCFCTDCAENREHWGPDYDEWRRAFPALDW